MLPSRFEYHRPETLDEALELLAEHGDEAKVLAGGQSLIPLMKLRFAAPAHLIDINRIPGLDGVREDDGRLRIGALVRHASLVDHPLLRERYPTMAAAAPQIADPIVRNLGTFGGSLVHCDPAGDWGAVSLALGATMVLRSRDRGEREVAAPDFLRDALQSATEPDELLTEVRIPTPAGRPGGAYLKMERKVGDFATVAAAVAIEMDGGTIARAGIGLAAVAFTNVKATAAEEALAGRAPSDDLFAEAGRLAAEATNPVDDVRGTADFKRSVVEVYVRRGLEAATGAMVAA
jgi:carbon-monoxide dehydrogenase medium subunit